MNVFLANEISDRCWPAHPLAEIVRCLLHSTAVCLTNSRYDSGKFPNDERRAACETHAAVPTFFPRKLTRC